MKFLADENLESVIVQWLRNQGHDVYWAAESAPASKDEALLRLARDEHRILITNDLDFGELVFRKGLPTAGILLLRFEEQTEGARLESLGRMWPTIHDQLEGRFVVATEKRVRVRAIILPVVE